MLKIRYKFIDLCAGIGGFHLGLHKLGMRCVFASEIDKTAREIYQQNFYNIEPDIFDDDRFNDLTFSLQGQMETNRYNLSQFIADGGQFGGDSATNFRQ